MILLRDCKVTDKEEGEVTFYSYSDIIYRHFSIIFYSKISVTFVNYMMK